MDPTSTTPQKRKPSPDTKAMSNSPVTPTKRRYNPTDEDVSPAMPSPKRRHPRSVDLDELYIKLERQYGFKLNLRDWTADRSVQTDEDKCRDKIRYFWYHHHEDLHARLERFRTDFSPKEQDIRSLNVLLRAPTRDSWRGNSFSSREDSRITSANTSFASDAMRIDTAQTSFTSVAQSDVERPAGECAYTSCSSEVIQDLVNADTEEWIKDWGELGMETPDFTPHLESIWDSHEEGRRSFNGIQINDAQSKMEGRPQGGRNIELLATVNSRMEDYHLRELPQRGLFVDDLPAVLLNASPRVRYECVRLSVECKLPIEEFAPFYNDSWEDYSTLRTVIRKRIPNDVNPPQWSSSKAWDEAGNGSERVIRTANFVFQGKRDPLMFELKLAPLQSDATSCRFFRKFGSHRFLRLLVPSLERCPLYHRKDKTQELLRLRFQEWLNQPSKGFMGYRWSVFYTKATKAPKKKRLRSTTDQAEGYTVYLFATAGVDLQPVSIAELLNWFMSFDKNKHLPYCKAYARFELGLSMTYETLTFKPSQIRSVGDTLADGQAEDLSLNDKKLSWVNIHDPRRPKVMNDGCARISARAAKTIWTKLNRPGPCPSIFQGRIGPWKGVWFVDGSTTDCSDSSEVWLEVTDSQQKFERHTSDMNDHSFDPRRLTLEVVSWSHKPSTSTFYLDFFPILEDRGISRDDLSDFVIDCLNEQKKQLNYSLGSPVTLLKWIEENRPVPDKAAAGRVVLASAMPSFIPSKAMRLLESGFNSSTCSYLSELVQTLISHHFTDISSALKIAIPQSTFVYGIADPLGCLGPSEIHLAFSASPSEELYPYLHGVETLVARHPALRRSDMQKVRAVFKPELRHLVDVVVFPTTGSFPLAGKLQGGDYDGDMFWVCWHQTIVKPFLNAPPPITMQPPEEFGIKVDRTKIGEVFTNVQGYDSTADFLARSFKFAWQPQQLGTCTNFLNNLCYAKNSISTPTIDAFADLHDYLVDSAKNGYLFANPEWAAFKASFKDIDVAKIVQPAYKTASETPLNSKPKKFDRPKYRKANIIDYLIYEVARPHALEIVLEVKNSLISNGADDRSLRDLSISLDSKDDNIIREVIRNLKDDILSIHGTRKQRSAHNLNILRTQPQNAEYNTADSKHRNPYEDILSEAHKAYTAVLPRASSAITDSVVVSHWLAKPAAHAPSYWDCIKASSVSRYTTPDFAFGVAGDVLCYMKAHSDPAGPPRCVVSDVYRNMKMRKIRAAGEGRAGTGWGVEEAEEDEFGEDVLEGLDIGFDVGLGEKKDFLDSGSRKLFAAQLDGAAELETKAAARGPAAGLTLSNSRWVRKKGDPDSGRSESPEGTFHDAVEVVSQQVSSMTV